MTCPACGVASADDSVRCVSCGLALAGGDGGHDVAPPDHVGLYLGDTPRIADAGTAVGVADFEVPEPRAPAATHAPWTLRQKIVIGLLFVALLVGAARVAHYVRHAPTAEEREFLQFLDSPALAPRDPELEFDADAAVGAVAVGEGAAFRAALAAHRPLPAAGSVPVHAYFDAVLAALLAADPDLALQLGAHPHPLRYSAPTAEADLRVLLVGRDAWRAARTWPGADTLPAHDRLDLDLIRSWSEHVLRDAGSKDRNLVTHLHDALVPLIPLRDVECCAAADRAAAARALLESLPAQLPAAVAAMQSPPAELVAATARRFESAAAWLPAYAESFTGIDAAMRNELRAAVTPAAESVRASAARLRADVLPRARGTLAIGRAALDAQLRAMHGLPMDARDVYLRALDELHDALIEMDDLSAPDSDMPPAPDTSDEAQIAQFRARMSAWLPDPPHDPGLRIGSAPAWWFGASWGAFYVDGGAVAPRGSGVIYIGAGLSDARGEEREIERLERAHLLAHETYPGHRMEALARADVCRVRRFAADGCFTEGWATYAESLIHETGDCRGGVVDRWICAQDRWWRARLVLIDVLLATGAADPYRVAELRRAGSSYDDHRADVGDAAVMQGYLIGYLVGRDEIVRLREIEERRLGAQFDLRAFHARLLREGPVPTRWVERQWARESGR